MYDFHSASTKFMSCTVIANDVATQTTKLKCDFLVKFTKILQFQYGIFKKKNYFRNNNINNKVLVETMQKNVMLGNDVPLAAY